MTLEDKVLAFRLHVLQRAKELGNVSAACCEAGISRTLYYRWMKRFALYGMDGLHPRQTAAALGRRPQPDSTKERKRLWRWLCLGLPGNLNGSASSWRGSVSLFPQVPCGEPYTGWDWERAYSDCASWRYTARRARDFSLSGHDVAFHDARYVTCRLEAGELICIDTFYIGNLKGVGKLW